MPIVRMTGEENAALPNVRVVRDYPGAEEGLIRHSKLCPHHNTRDVSGVFSPECIREGKFGETCTGPGKPLYMMSTYVGRVLDNDGEINGRDDSDFYALVWDDETEAPRKVVYASTRGWTYPNHAIVDADEATRAKYEAYCDRMRASQRAAARIKAAEKAIENAKARHNAPEHGRVMVVTRSYQNAIKGAEGTVFWTRDKGRSVRVGLRTSDRKDPSSGRYLDVFFANASQLANVAPFEAPETLAKELSDARAEWDRLNPPTATKKPR